MRTCLLCDKPLSRIWLGAGEDFCSREHRNQYRLRRGMDRLLEANKVANLMRRRESPKPISATREIAETGIPRRGCFEAPFMQAGDGPMLREAWSRMGAAQVALGLPPTTSFIDAVRNGNRPSVTERREAAAPRLEMESSSPELPSHRTRVSVRIMAAGPAGGARLAAGKLQDGSRPSRSTGIVWRNTKDLYIDSERLTPAAFHAFQEPHGCREPELAGPPGYGLRVSMGAGFRIQAARLRRLRLDLPDPRVPQNGHAMTLQTASPAGHPDRRPAAGPASPGRSPGIPKLDWDDPEVKMKWPGLLAPFGGREEMAVRPGVDLPPQGHPEVWSPLDGVFPPPIKHGGRDRAGILPRIARPAGAAPAARAAFVPIGCVADGVDARPGAPPESRSSIEERFDGGWKNWTGGYANWTVDAAGARTGGLALFTPSLEWRDYEVEFFTRIENRSVTWLYRATGLNDYYMAALTALPGKGFAFTRRSVSRGKPGAAYTAPLSVLPNPKNAYLIRMRIAGTQFSLSIDGQLIETWTDSRLSTGGVGFVGAPEDRARIYWVRFYPGPAKEFPRK